MYSRCRICFTPTRQGGRTRKHVRRPGGRCTRGVLSARREFGIALCSQACAAPSTAALRPGLTEPGPAGRRHHAKKTTGHSPRARLSAETTSVCGHDRQVGGSIRCGRIVTRRHRIYSPAVRAIRGFCPLAACEPPGYRARITCERDLRPLAAFDLLKCHRPLPPFGGDDPTGPVPSREREPIVLSRFFCWPPRP